MVRNPTRRAETFSTDDAGTVTATYDHDVVGCPPLAAPCNRQLWQFTGEQTDDATGFLYLRARYYDPAAGGS